MVAGLGSAHHHLSIVAVHHQDEVAECMTVCGGDEEQHDASRDGLDEDDTPDGDDDHPQEQKHRLDTVEDDPRQHQAGPFLVCAVSQQHAGGRLDDTEHYGDRIQDRDESNPADMPMVQQLVDVEGRKHDQHHANHRAYLSQPEGSVLESDAAAAGDQREVGHHRAAGLET